MSNTENDGDRHERRGPQIEGPWAVILDQNRWGETTRRPLLEDGLESQKDALDVIGEYANNDETHPSNYRAIRPEWVESYPFEVVDL